MNNNAYAQDIVDFSLQGVVGIRLVNPPVGTARALSRRLGPPLSEPKADADIVIRFVENLTPPTLTYLGLNQAAFAGDAFYLLDEKDGQAQALIPFDAIGDQCEIICRRESRSVPLLFDIVRLTLLKKNYLPLHASAFLYEGQGILVVGWAKGGKTEMLLSFVSRGATYVGDEWLILSDDGRQMFGLPVPVSIWDWQFRYVPELLPAIGWQKRLFFKAVHLLEGLQRTSGNRVTNKVLPLALLDQALPYFKKGLRLRELPETFFGERVYKRPVVVDKLFLVMSHSSARIDVEPWDPLDISRRMAQSNEYEQTDFFSYYQAFKFAFPQRQSVFLDTASERQRSLMDRALTGKEAYRVLHPYPVSFTDLYETVRPYCERSALLPAAVAGRVHMGER